MTDWASSPTRHDGEGRPPRLEPGSVIAGYELQKPLGHGGMAVVWLARDTALDRQVALKILAPSLTADDQYRMRFITESRAASAIDDPHIIPVYQAGEADGVLYIAMRYARGGDVGSLCRAHGPLSPARVAAVISPIASALDAAHEEGLVHRDVKPANMLIDARPRRPDHVYLADFGLSLRSLSAPRLTMAGYVMGTPDYCAPEQINGKAVTGKTDQYALACSVMELLTGTPPFPRDDSQAILYAHLLESPPPLSSRRPGLPPGADEVLARAMAKAPDDRYPSCQDFVDDLRAALGLASYLPVGSDDHHDDPHATDIGAASQRAAEPASRPDEGGQAPRRGRHRAPPADEQPAELATVAMADPFDSGAQTAPPQAAQPQAAPPQAAQPQAVPAAAPAAPAAPLESPLAPPGTMRSQVKPDAVLLTWTAPEDSDELSYKVVRMTTAPDGGQPDFRVLGTSYATEFEDAGVPGGVLVSYEVTAVLGRRASAAARTAPVLMVRDVANLRARPEAAGITLNWSLPIRFGKVVVERQADPRAAMTMAPRRMVVEGSSWTDISPAHGVEFIYHVFAEYRDASGTAIRTQGDTVRAASSPPPRPGRQA